MSRDSEENIDGELTKPGECYDGFACLSYGQTALSMYVNKVEVDHERTFMNLYRKARINRGGGEMKRSVLRRHLCP